MFALDTFSLAHNKTYENVLLCETIPAGKCHVMLYLPFYLAGQ